jgi:hypothetical protein
MLRGGGSPGNFSSFPENSTRKSVFPKTFDRFRGLPAENPPNKEEVA